MRHFPLMQNGPFYNLPIEIDKLIYSLMNITMTAGRAVLTTSIEELNSREMRQMYEMRKRIETVLKSHENKDEKKQYLNDDELKLIHAILYVFTKHMGDSLESEFDKVIEQLNTVEQPTDCPAPETTTV